MGIGISVGLVMIPDPLILAAEDKSYLKAALKSAKPLYVLPREDVVGEVLIPALKCVDSVDCMMGFFSSHSFSEIAPGLASFLSRTTHPLRLIVSPFLSSADQEAIKSGLSSTDEIAANLVIQSLPDADALSRHTLSCLSWLIREGRLSMRIALMRESIFHSKVWIFHQGSDTAALHGSLNMTTAGLRRNREQATLSRSWKGEETRFHVDRLQREFDDLWSGGDSDCIVVDLPKAIKDRLMRDFHSEQMPTEKDFQRLWRIAHGLGEEPPEYIEVNKRIFSIPSYLEYRSGEYEHQGRAVDAWKAAHWRGVLEMATGSGKTITAMIGANLLHQEVGNLLIVIAAPYRPLIEQWCEEVELFGVTPINLTLTGGASKRDGEIKAAGRRLRRGHSEVEILVVSNDTLCTSEFIESVSTLSVSKLLIADECHNLGAAGFILDPPQCFDYRLGLSATPIRQYDEEGTDALFSYFGDVCFQFTLEDAIGRCLTPYDYHVHFVSLTTDEMERWYELTNLISRLAWKIRGGVKDSYLDNLLRQRRLVLETAAGKIDVLSHLLDREDLRHLRYTLIYATDKDPKQLDQVNHLLNERGVLFHQLTHEETTNRETTRRILSSFQDGQLQVITAKRVLDEGVNVPQIKTAFILASTTVKRQWVQRRGRLLRTCKSIGKTHAVIHDFISVPPQTADAGTVQLDEDARKIVRSELDRVWEFARLCRNGASPDGPYGAVQRLQELANKG